MVTKLDGIEKRCSVPVGVHRGWEDAEHENYVGVGECAGLLLRVLAWKAYSLCESVNRFVVVTGKL